MFKEIFLKSPSETLDWKKEHITCSWPGEKYASLVPILCAGTVENDMVKALLKYPRINSSSTTPVYVTQDCTVASYYSICSASQKRNIVLSEYKNTFIQWLIYLQIALQPYSMNTQFSTIISALNWVLPSVHTLIHQCSYAHVPVFSMKPKITHFSLSSYRLPLP